VCGRAREARLMDVRVHDLRAFTHDRHRTVDDRHSSAAAKDYPETGTTL